MGGVSWPVPVTWYSCKHDSTIKVPLLNWSTVTIWPQWSPDNQINHEVFIILPWISHLQLSCQINKTIRYLNMIKKIIRSFNFLCILERQPDQWASCAAGGAGGWAYGAHSDGAEAGLRRAAPAHLPPDGQHERRPQAPRQQVRENNTVVTHLKLRESQGNSYKTFKVRKKWNCFSNVLQNVEIVRFILMFC